MELEESLKTIKDKFFKYFDIQDDPSEIAYFTGTVAPAIDEDNLWKLLILGTKYKLFLVKSVNSKEEYIIELLNNFIKLGEQVKEEVQKIFNPWRF